MKKTIKLAGILMIMTIVACAFTLEPAMAATKTMKVFGDVYKKGKVVYCASGIGVHKVNLKTGKVNNLATGTYSCMMKKKGKYLYYQNSYPVGMDLHRVNVSSGKDKRLASGVEDYVIVKKKIYYQKYSNDYSKLSNRVMTLSGKNKRKSTVTAKQNYEKTNAEGYKIVVKYIDESIGLAKYWLKTPSGKKYYLGKGERL